MVCPSFNRTGVLIGRWSQKTDTHTGRWPCNAEVQTGEMHLQVKEHHGYPAEYQRLGRGKEGCSYRYQREHGHADNLVSDYQPPKW